MILTSLGESKTCAQSYVIATREFASISATKLSLRSNYVDKPSAISSHIDNLASNCLLKKSDWNASRKRKSKLINLRETRAQYLKSVWLDAFNAEMLKEVNVKQRSEKHSASQIFEKNASAVCKIETNDSTATGFLSTGNIECSIHGGAYCNNRNVYLATARHVVDNKNKINCTFSNSNLTLTVAFDDSHTLFLGPDTVAVPLTYSTDFNFVNRIPLVNRSLTSVEDFRHSPPPNSTVMLDNFWEEIWLPDYFTQSKPGQSVFILGHPKGSSSLKISSGIISGCDKLPMSAVDSRWRGLEGFENNIVVVQAPISSGSSGSPVFNEQGMVVGIAIAKKRHAENYNYVSPTSNLIKFCN
jgi:hypothetical protein